MRNSIPSVSVNYPANGRSAATNELGIGSGKMTALSPCFASDLDDLYRPAAWIFGHTHWPTELWMRGVKLLRNVSVGCEYEINKTDLTARIRRGLSDQNQVEADA